KLASYGINSDLMHENRDFDTTASSKVLATSITPLATAYCGELKRVNPSKHWRPDRDKRNRICRQKHRFLLRPSSEVLPNPQFRFRIAHCMAFGHAGRRLR